MELYEISAAGKSSRLLKLNKYCMDVLFDVALVALLDVLFDVALVALLDVLFDVA